MTHGARYMLGIIAVAGVAFAILFATTQGDASTARLSEMDLPLLVASMLFLAVALLSRGLIWKVFLGSAEVHIGWRPALISRSLPILGKYVPGKIWALAGTASAVSQSSGSFSRAAVLTMWFQLSVVAGGVMVAVFGVLALGASLPMTWYTYVILCVCAIVVVLALDLPQSRRFLVRLISRALPGTAGLRLPPLRYAILLGMVSWLILGGAQLMMLQAIGLDAGLAPVFFQPLANSVGMLAGFAPGGIGVREGVMVGYLSLAGISPATAIVASGLARLWSLGAEVLVFLVGLILRHYEKTADNLKRPP